ncbi:hypothetical protein I549_1294 [Mycobacterium avium subsp. avium 2285 (R)]|nr:hypothetical protein I549_1294 [Mycobacterium avium subsp. avium 2285 (R)]
MYSPTSARFAAGSVPLRICASAIRMSASLGPATMRAAAAARGGVGRSC